MKASFAGFLVTVVAMATLAASAPQVRDTAPPPQATARIRGTVVGAESGRAVRFAKVTLESSSGAFEAVTDDAGGFSFERLRPGSYNLHVSKAGYLDTTYGQVRPGTLTPGKRIALADREQMDDVVVRLSQGGSISGVIRDDRGDPAYRANVHVSRWVMRNGIRYTRGCRFDGDRRARQVSCFAPAAARLRDQRDAQRRRDSGNQRSADDAGICSRLLSRRGVGCVRRRRSLLPSVRIAPT